MCRVKSMLVHRWYSADRIQQDTSTLSEDEIPSVINHNKTYISTQSQTHYLIIHVTTSLQLLTQYTRPQPLMFHLTCNSTVELTRGKSPLDRAVLPHYILHSDHTPQTKFIPFCTFNLVHCKLVVHAIKERRNFN